MGVYGDRTMRSASPAIFLDRDGVLNQAIVIDGRPYPPRAICDLEIPPDAIEGCRLLKSAGFTLICVTNQPDVARGLMSRSDLDDINRAVVEALGLDDLRTCPHCDADECSCRKPKPGLLLAAAAAHHLDMSKSYLVGDRWRDIKAGLSAGCRSVFIDRRYSERRPSGMSFSCGTLTEAARFILRDYSTSGRTTDNGVPR
jgi:D-glycero-D-manno-heptose 1,7-bisphosphate phosphatase